MKDKKKVIKKTVIDEHKLKHSKNGSAKITANQQTKEEKEHCIEQRAESIEHTHTRTEERGG